MAPVSSLTFCKSLNIRSIFLLYIYSSTSALSYRVRSIILLAPSPMPVPSVSREYSQPSTLFNLPEDIRFWVEPCLLGTPLVASGEKELKSSS
jgi:hypothetical protein